MKKIIIFLSILIVSLLLVGCKGNKAQIVSQKFEGNTYTFVVNTNENLNEDEQVEYAYSIVHTIYKELHDDINQSKRVLKLTLQINKIDSLTLIFNINESLENPGLKLLKKYFH